MNDRFAKMNYLASTGMRIRALGILTIMLVFAAASVADVQETTKGSKPVQPQASKTAPAPSGKSAPPLETQVAAVISDLKLAADDTKLTVTISTDRLITPKEFRLDNPPRLVLDFPDAENRIKSSQIVVNAFSVKQVRVQQFQNSSPKVVRVVFDLEEGFGKHEVSLDRASVRIVFHKGQAASAAPQSPAKPAIAQTADRTPNTPKPAAQVIVESPKAADGSSPGDSDAAPAKIQPRQAPLVAALAAASGFPAPAPHPNLTPAEPPSYSPPPPRPISMASSPFSGQPLTLDLVDIPLVDFFRLMAEEGGINIVLDPEVKGHISIKVVKVPWDQIFDAALINNDLDKQIDGNLVRVARKSTLQDEAKQKESLKRANLLAADLETRIKRLNYAKAASLMLALSEQKTVRGTVVVDERTNSLVMTDIPSSLDKLSQLIEALDLPQAQVQIEARIVSATRDFARDIGIQFGFVDGNLQRVTVGGPNTFGTIGGTRPSMTPKSTYVAGNPETGRGASKDDVGSSGAVSTGNAGNYNVNLPATRAFGGLGISIGNIFDTFLLDAAITAGESKGLAKLISQPRVVAQNNSPAVITQGLRFPVPVEANNTITIQFYNAALTLTVTPQITYEGNIVLDLKVENNTADFAHQVMQVPSIRTSESTTRVLVSDGGTTVIGGILVDDESTQEDKVPGLGSLPLVGNLFRRSSTTRSTQEVLFFVTPRILK
jgi:type IV pilus secretin PilQ/predicted competence protein